MDAPSVIAVVGGGAAGFFAAIRVAELRPDLPVVLLEQGSRVLQKVKISGGGRCNVTHDCMDPRELVQRYPRGSRELLGPFHRFGPVDTIAWFEQRGVRLKTEADGRMFPTTNTSETILQCLMRSAKEAGVEVRTRCAVQAISRDPADGSFTLRLKQGEPLRCQKVLLATGGSPRAEAYRFAQELGHGLVPLRPSLFTFKIKSPLLAGLAGISVEPVEVTAVDQAQMEAQRGPLLITHAGLSGPAALRLSAWGARELGELGHQFSLKVNWLPEQATEQTAALFNQQRQSHGKRNLAKNSLFETIPRRLWARMVEQSGIAEGTVWGQVRADAADRLVQLLHQTPLQVHGRSANKEEFVTCGGIPLREVNFKTMESRLCSGLHFAGEVLDIDGITGGFNFQAAWTTGFLAGTAMAG